MKIRERYIKPEIENILLETVDVMATSVVAYDDDDHVVNGKGRAKQFWDNSDR